MLRRGLFAFAAIALAAGVTACSSSTAPSSTGATISGSLVTTTTEATTSSGPSDVSEIEAPVPPPLTVTVVGSRSQSTVDQDGNFTLTGVPAGDVVLRFSGTDVDARLTVSAVQDGQTITIVVSMANGSAELASDDRSLRSGANRQLEGRVDAIPPVAAANTFVVDGQVVTTDANTKFTSGDASSTVAALVVGVRVHVAGAVTGTTFLAKSVDIQNTNAALPVVVNGIAQGFTGTASTFSFTVGGTLVKGDATTTFTGNSVFANLANGKRVEVKGLQGNGFVTATSIHVNPN